MQTLKFDPQLLSLFDSGAKNATTRLGVKENLTLGPAVADFGTVQRRIYITKLEVLEFSGLHLNHALMEGYDCTADLRSALRRYYPDIEPSSVLTFIRYEGN